MKRAAAAAAAAGSNLFPKKYFRFCSTYYIYIYTHIRVCVCSSMYNVYIQIRRVVPKRNHYNRRRLFFHTSPTIKKIVLTFKTSINRTM